MLESWMLSKLEPLNGSPLIIMRDPQRMIQRGAHVVDGWPSKMATRGAIAPRIDRWLPGNDPARGKARIEM